MVLSWASHPTLLVWMGKSRDPVTKFMAEARAQRTRHDLEEKLGERVRIVWVDR
jgi:hypothetical protein